jgi:hypothetical protein
MRDVPTRGRLAALAALAADLNHVLPVLRNFRAAAPADVRHVLPVLRDLSSAAPADGRHVIAVQRDFAPAFSSCGCVAFRVAMPSTTGNVLPTLKNML